MDPNVRSIEGNQLVPFRDVGFMARADMASGVPPNARIGTLFVLEANGSVEMISELVVKNPNRLMQVTLAPERWAGDVLVASPVYARTTQNDRNFDVQIEMRGAGSYLNLRASADQLAANLLFIALPFRQKETPTAGNMVTTYLQPLAAALPSTDAEAKAVAVDFAQPFRTDTYGQGKIQQIYYTGEGYAFVSLIRLNRTSSGRSAFYDQFFNGRLEVLRTVSNVLKLPVTVEKPRQ
jgi:hypothetical protein